MESRMTDSLRESVLAEIRYRYAYGIKNRQCAAIERKRKDDGILIGYPHVCR